MKIVLLIDYFQPKMGYQEYFLAREFNKSGHQVFVVSSNYYFPFPDYQNSVYKVLGKRKRMVGKFREDGFNIYRLPMLFQSKNGAITLLSGLGNCLREIRPDIVYSDGVFTPLAFQAAYFKKRVGYKLFYDTHASSFNSNLHDTLWKNSYMLLFKNLIMPYIKKMADGFTAVGESEKMLLTKEYNLGEDQAKVIPLGADCSTFFPDKKKRKEVRKKLKLNENELLIIYAGKITPNKDINILLQAFFQVHQKINNLKLLIIGGGETAYINKLKFLIKKNHLSSWITWQEPVENQFLGDFYNAADCGIWPGDLSNTVLEAMSCGLPVILPEKISDDQSTHHLLKQKNGLSFERKNFDSLSEKMSYLFKNLKKLKDMGKRSRKLIEDEYSWEKIAKKYLSLYEKK